MTFAIFSRTKTSLCLHVLVAVGILSLITACNRKKSDCSVQASIGSSGLANEGDTERTKIVTGVVDLGSGKICPVIANEQEYIETYQDEVKENAESFPTTKLSFFMAESCHNEIKSKDADIYLAVDPDKVSILTDYIDKLLAYEEEDSTSKNAGDTTNTGNQAQKVSEEQQQKLKELNTILKSGTVKALKFTLKSSTRATGSDRIDDETSLHQILDSSTGDIAATGGQLKLDDVFKTELNIENNMISFFVLKLIQVQAQSLDSGSDLGLELQASTDTAGTEGGGATLPLKHTLLIDSADPTVPKFSESTLASSDAFHRGALAVTGELNPDDLDSSALGALHGVSALCQGTECQNQQEASSAELDFVSHTVPTGTAVLDITMLANFRLDNNGKLVLQHDQRLPTDPQERQIFKNNYAWMSGAASIIQHAVTAFVAMSGDNKERAIAEINAQTTREQTQATKKVDLTRIEAERPGQEQGAEEETEKIDTILETHLAKVDEKLAQHSAQIFQEVKNDLPPRTPPQPEATGNESLCGSGT